MFRNVLPKKSVLKKNKWALVILALVILVGLYWYSKKSQENYYNSKGEGEGAWGGTKALKKGIDGEDLAPVRVDTLSETDQTNLFRFANQISGIRDAYYTVQKSTDIDCSISRLNGKEGASSTVTDINEYGPLIDITQKDTPATSIWTYQNGTDESADCTDKYKGLFNNHQTEIYTELQIVDSQINQALTEGSTEPEPEYIDEMIHEQVTLYLGHTGCEHSNDFVTKIWTDISYKNANDVPVEGENLRQQIIDEFPGIELDVATMRPALVKTGVYGASGMPQDIIRCEHTDAVNKDRSATDNIGICKLAGFYADPKDDKLSFPLIQYSFLGKTNKDRDSSDKGYTRYTANFDPTKKLVTDGENGEKMVEDVVDGVTKTVYTSAKIIAWLSNLRGK